MFVRNTALLALAGASAVVGSPLNKRQASSVVSSVASSASSAASSAVESVTGSAAATGSGASTSVDVTPTSSAAESATSALGSAVSSAATATSTASGMTNMTSSDALSFGCPSGYSLTYVVGVAPYAGVDIEQAYSALENWGTAIPPPIMSVNSTGEGEGATRSWMASLGETNLSVSEVLTRVNETPSTFLEQEWNLTTPINVSEAVMISNYTNVLTLYSNSTDNETTVQLFSNLCVTDQAAGLELFTQIVTVYLQGLSELFMNGTSSDNSTSSSTAAGGASSSAASGTSSVASAASSGASSAASEATSGASGVVGTASSAVAGAISTATGAPASVATSVLGAITSAI